MVEEVEKFRGLHTMLPVEVHDELTELAKTRVTFSGNWDYGIVIRELLWVYNVFFNINTRLDELEISFNELKKMMFDEKKDKTKVKSEGNPMGLLGKHFKGEKEDGTHKGSVS